MTYLEINEKVFERHKKEARELSIANCGEEEGKEEFSFEDLELNYDINDTPCYNSETNTLDFFTSLIHKKETLGVISLNIPLDFDLVISIIESYRKRLGKLKTVLEATKD